MISKGVRILTNNTEKILKFATGETVLEAHRLGKFFVVSKLKFPYETDEVEHATRTYVISQKRERCHGILKEETDANAATSSENQAPAVNNDKQACSYPAGR